MSSPVRSLERSSTSTTIRSAIHTVEKRWETSTVTAPGEPQRLC
jgi:hypothetical protein